MTDAAREPSGPTPPTTRRGASAAAALAALGVVYGDLGTSPLYAMRECLAWGPPGASGFAPHAVPPTPAAVLGVTSLIAWTLGCVVAVKYLAVVLRADNKGEGGILALAALLTPATPGPRLGAPLLLALVGAGLLLGDGMITPAISVLGAVEGLGVRAPSLAPLAAPLAAGVLAALFLVQRAGAGRLGRVFGPVMLLWFAAIAAAGIPWIVREPGVLAALDPRHAGALLARSPGLAATLLGSVVLVVTGAEALYADLGHFGPRPIRLAWYAVVMPALLASYLGQAALLLDRPVGTVRNPFFELVPAAATLPMVALATAAAVIASQALVSGVFSLAHQAVQLGYLPRLAVAHTSPLAVGQIYVPTANAVLAVGTLALVLAAGSSSALAAAYGVAVTGTMAITTLLLHGVMRQRWGVGRAAATAATAAFLAIDLALAGACATKLAQGGWLPLTVAAAWFAVVSTWWRGRTELARRAAEATLPEALLLADLEAAPPPRVRGAAVFLAPGGEGIPAVLLHHVKHNQVLHEQVVLLSIETARVPWVVGDSSLEVRPLRLGLHRVIVRQGFMQRADVPLALARCARLGLAIDPAQTTYYLGRDTIRPTGPARLARWRKALYVVLARNAGEPTDYFGLPPNRVVELGARLEL